MGMDHKGERNGMMVVKRKSSNEYWLCYCDCGKSRHVHESRLATTLSCGCSHKLVRHSHGAYKTPEYRAWIHMIERCTKETSQKFADYGGRGITVCERWMFSFQNFIDDMGPKPTPKHEIDRIDNDGPYSPENCRWATRKEQNNNRRNNRRLTINGETRTLAEWARLSGLGFKTIQCRIDNYGWTLEQAVSLPPQKGRKPV